MHSVIIKLLIAKQNRIEYPVILCVKLGMKGIHSAGEGSKSEEIILSQINQKNTEDNI